MRPAQPMFRNRWRSQYGGLGAGSLLRWLCALWLAMESSASYAQPQAPVAASATADAPRSPDGSAQPVTDPSKQARPASPTSVSEAGSPEPAAPAAPAAATARLADELSTVPDPARDLQSSASAAQQIRLRMKIALDREERRLRRQRTALLAVGSGLFAASYLPAVLLAALGVGPELAIPIVGPVISVARTPSDSGNGYAAVGYVFSAGLVFNAIAQTAGIVVLAAGIHSARLHAQRTPTVRLVPAVGGLTLVGTF